MYYMYIVLQNCITICLYCIILNDAGPKIHLISEDTLINLTVIIGQFGL